MKKKAARNHSKILFTSSEIRKAVYTLKDSKSPRMDQINIELIKY